MRSSVYAVFDPLWMDANGQFSKGKRKNNRYVRRHRAYRWLSEQLGLDMNSTHIGMFSIEQCKQALEIINNIGSIIDGDSIGECS